MAGPGRKERKVVTVVFADLIGFTARAEQLDPEDVQAILEPYHARLRSELERRGGTVEKFIGDAVVAVFGAPVVHEDDAERAVRAALAIRDWAVEDGAEVRIAVNSGEALVSVDARPELGEGMVAGDVVNTASRLQASAPENGVLVGEATYRATRATIDYADAAPVRAKGKAEPVRVWEALQARARVGLEVVGRGAALIGRERELHLLVDSLARARTAREPQLVTLVGVPGIGKSRLVAELFTVVDAEPELIFWRHGRSVPYGETTPLTGFAEMVKAHAGILDTDGADATAAKLHRMVAEMAPDDASVLEERLAPLVGLPSTTAASGDARAQNFAAWRRFVEALAERSPTVLVFEDLHWADDDLLDFVDALVDWAADVPLLVVASARPELFERRPGWGGGKRNALTVSLAPLGDEDTARLLAALTGSAVISADTQTRLLARAGGNPLYAEQFAAMVGERGEEGTVPETVHGIIAARVDALAAEEKELLHTAAVLGRRFWLGAVVAVDGTERATAEGHLLALQRKELVHRARRSSVAGETEFTFTHALVRDVAYGQIPREPRLSRHRAAAAWLESLAPDRAEDRADMLAHHYLAAIALAASTGLGALDLHVRARRALHDAADRAYALGSFTVAAGLYGQAIELWDDARDEDRLTALVRRAEATFYANGRPDLDALTEASDGLAALGRRELAAKAEIILALGWWWAGSGADAEQHATRAFDLVRDAPASPEKATVLVEWARLLMVASRGDEALTVGREGMDMARQFGLDTMVASALVTIGTVHGLEGGDPERAARDLESGIALAERLKAPQQAQRGYNNLAEVTLLHGRVVDVRELYRRARSFSERYGEPFGVRWIAAAECEVSYLAGDWRLAEEQATAFLAEIDAGSPHYQEATARGVRALLRRAWADTEGADRDAERGLHAARAVRDPQAMGPALIVVAILLLERGRLEEAHDLVDEMLALKGSVGGFPHTFAIEAAWLARDSGRLVAWSDCAKADAPSRYLDAGLRIAAGDDAAAAELLEAQGYVTQAAYARLRAAEACVASGRRTEAEPFARSALAFYRPRGADVFVARAERSIAASA